MIVDPTLLPYNDYSFILVGGLSVDDQVHHKIMIYNVMDYEWKELHKIKQIGMNQILAIKIPDNMTICQND